ncbi:hypothetical protein Tco_1193297 [Tanacetum coccineum]
MNKGKKDKNHVFTVNLKHDGIFSPVGYESKLAVDLYSEHYGYNAMDLKNSEGIDYESGYSSDAYFPSDKERLLDVVSDWLPNVEQKKCTRHVFANFKKKLSGVQLQRLFWLAAGTTVEQNFYNKMEQIKAIHPEAYDYLRKWHCKKCQQSKTCSKNKSNHHNSRRHKALYYAKIGTDEYNFYELER